MNDYTELVAEARRTVAPSRRRLNAGEWVTDIGNLLNVERLADAVEALSAERDALWAQLDGMTTSVEYAYGALDAPDTITPTGEDIDDLGSARYNAEEYWLSVLQRTVKRGPWTPVEGDA